MNQNDSITHGKALALLLIGAVLISFSAVFVQWADVAPTISAFYRMLIGGVVLLSVGRLRSPWPAVSGKVLRLAALAGVFIAIDLMMWHLSIGYIGPGMATLLANFQVFILAGIGVTFLGEKVTWRFMLSILLGLGGLYLMVGVDWAQEGAGQQWGVMLALAAAVFYSFYLLTLRHSQRLTVRFDVWTNMGIISLTAALVAGLTSGFEFGSLDAFVIPNLKTWGALLGLGLVSQVAGWVLISTGLPKVDASLAGLTLLLQPALAFFWDHLFFGRSFSPLEMGGMALALGAIYLGSARKKKQ